jgi:hypothetical protein
MVKKQSQPNRSPFEVSDPEVEEMLCDAYDVPDVPRSLMTRLDRQIANDWGQSPGLVSPRWGQTALALSRKMTKTRAIPVIAMAALLVIVVVVINFGSSRSAWAEMLAALESKGVASMQIPDGTRWIALSEQVVIEEGKQTSSLWNYEQNQVLIRQSGATELQRRSLQPFDSLPPKDRTVLAFLLGPSVVENTDGLSLTGQRTETILTDRGDATSLVLSLTNNTGENWELRLTLDEQTRLPEQCEIVQDSRPRESLSLTYPSSSFVALQQKHFPLDQPGIAIAQASQPVEELQNEKPRTDTEGTTRAALSTPEEPRRNLEVVSWQSPDAEPSHWDSVEVKQLPPTELVTQIDTILEDVWEEKGIVPTIPADDVELLRRVYLDLTGRTPTVPEVRSYLNDPNPDRYERLVDRLLKSHDHASHLATVWRKVLIPEGIDLTRFGGVQEFDEWLTQKFKDGEPYDKIVSTLMLTEGRFSEEEPGPLVFYAALKLDPDQIAARTARAFLGMRLECATCHDHPFEPWKQTDFWGYAAFFAQISRPRGKLEQASRVMRVHDLDHGEVMLPDTEQVVEPRFLDGTRIDAFGDDLSRRERFVRWLIDPENPYFARATANRVWGQLFGKGITDPIDNFGVQHKPRIPEIIDLLAGHLIASDFQLSEIVRAIVHTRAYRLSSGAETADPERLEWFAQMQVKMLTAEQIYDSITVASYLDTRNAQAGDFSVVRFRNPARQEFLQQFSTPSGSMTDYQAGIPQALTLMNGTLIASATGLSSSGILKSLEAPFFSNRDRIEVLYLATLSRPPRDSEWEVLEQYLPLNARGQELQEGLADLLWVLLNSAEFTMNH